MRISDGVQTCALPILGENWSPLRAEFQHSAPGDYRIHRQLFRCPLEYGAERSAVVVSRDDIRRPTPHGNAHLLAFLEQHLESVRRAMPVDFVEIGRAHVELQSLMRISYAVFCLTQKNQTTLNPTQHYTTY